LWTFVAPLNEASWSFGPPHTEYCYVLGSIGVQDQHRGGPAPADAADLFWSLTTQPGLVKVGIMSTQDDGIQARLGKLETESALSRLVADYCHGVDRRDLDRFLNVWREDATWDNAGTIYQGRQEIGRGLVEVMWPAFQATHHWTVNLVTEVDGNTASGLSNVSFQGLTMDGDSCMAAATYHDVFVRQDDNWLIAKRVIEMHHFAVLPGVPFSLSSES
jgi:ketosteroid isomerase-like protein